MHETSLDPALKDLIEGRAPRLPMAEGAMIESFAPERTARDDSFAERRRM
jgi:hypothetical protein